MLTRTTWPCLTTPALRSGTASCSRSGSCRTTVTTGVPAERILSGHRHAFADHAVDRRSQDGVVQLLAGERELGAPLRQHRLAVAHFLERVLMARLRRFPASRSAVSSSAFAEMPRVTKVAMRSRWLRASSSVACAERTSAGLLGVDVVVLALDREAQPGARLLQGRFRLLAPQLEIGGRKTGDDLTAADRRAEIDEQLLDAAGDLQAEHHLFFGGQRAADGDGVDDRHALGARLTATCVGAPSSTPCGRRRAPRPPQPEAAIETRMNKSVARPCMTPNLMLPLVAKA